MTESLAGRFELIRMGHWSYREMKEAFGWDLKQYVYFGGYPGSAGLISDESRWRSYIKDSIIEPSISKDVLMTTVIYKPALLRQLFELGCSYSGELLSLNKMLGQLQNAGLPAFQKLFHPRRAFVVGSGGVSIEDFLQADLSKLF